MADINFIYYLSCLLLLLSICSIFLFKFDIMEPANIFLLTMTASSFFGALNAQRWSLSINYITLIIVLGGCFSFFAGCFFSYYEFRKIPGQILHDTTISIDNANKKIFILCIISVVLLGFSFKEVYSLALQLGNTGGISTMIGTVRYPMERQEISFSLGRLIDLYLYKAYVMFVFIFFLNTSLKKESFIFSTYSLRSFTSHSLF